jgi:outer membrane protein assembly factor BamD
MVLDCLDLPVAAWRRGIAWFSVAGLALVMPASPASSLSWDRVEVADAAAAAQAKVDNADQLAGREMDVARYFLGRRDYPAAINRFKIVVTRYPATPQVEEALEHLTELYLALGIAREARTAVAVLGRKFPDSPHYKNALDLLEKAGLEPYEAEDSWISPTFK